MTGKFITSLEPCWWKHNEILPWCTADILRCVALEFPNILDFYKQENLLQILRKFSFNPFIDCNISYYCWIFFPLSEVGGAAQSITVGPLPTA